MINNKTELLSHYLAARLVDIAAGHGSAWDDALQSLDKVRGDYPDVTAAIEARDASALQAIIDQWAAGERKRPMHDKAVLKSALRAFRKRLGSTRLDDESTVGGGPMSAGRASEISGVTPPSTYPEEIWKELVRLG